MSSGITLLSALLNMLVRLFLLTLIYHKHDLDASQNSSIKCAIILPRMRLGSPTDSDELPI